MKSYRNSGIFRKNFYGKICLIAKHLFSTFFLKQTSSNKLIFFISIDLVIEKKVNDLAHLAFDIETSKKSWVIIHFIINYIIIKFNINLILLFLET